MKKNVHTQKGISLVISLMMMTLLLSISFSISNIILRQIRLTNISTNSQTAFYAADSALECALYWDTHSDGTVRRTGDGSAPIFGTSSVQRWGDGTNPIWCGTRNFGDPVAYTYTSNEEIATTTFSVEYGPSACARVQVVKSAYRTTISTSGYNVGLNEEKTDCDLSNAISKRVVERGLVFSH